MDTFHFSMLFSMVVTLVIADYECLCNYAIQLAIQSEPNSTATAIGQIYEFDCKPTYRLAPNTPNWFAVQYEHKVGFVHSNDQTKVQTCPGPPSQSDLVIATTTIKTTSIGVNITMTPKVFSLSTTTPLPTLSSPASARLTYSSYRPIGSTNGTTTPAPYSPSSILTTLISNHTSQRTTKTTNPIASSTTRVMTHPSTTATVPKTANTTPFTTRTTILTTTRESKSISTTYASTKRAATITTKTSKPTTYPVTFKQTTTVHTTPTSSLLTHPSTMSKTAPTVSFTTRSIASTTTRDSTATSTTGTTTTEATTIRQTTTTSTPTTHPVTFKPTTELTTNTTQLLTTLITKRNSTQRPTTTQITTKRPATTQTTTIQPITTQTITKRPTTTQKTTQRPATTLTTTERTTTTQTTTKRTHTTVTTTIRKQNHCPPQVTSHHILEAKGRCYEFIKTPHKTWPDAEHDCNSRGGHLVSIGSKKEQFVINTELWRRHFGSDDKHVWIGLNDRDSEGAWKWSSGERMTYTYWGKGESNGNFEDCALMDMGKIGHWRDYPCSGFLFNTQKHGYVCEYNLV